MILICGIPSEPPIRMVMESLIDLGADFVVLNPRDLDDIGWSVWADGVNLEGIIQIGSRQFSLSVVRSVYSRMPCPTQLPEFDGLPETHPRLLHARCVTDAIRRWEDCAHALVVNRPSASFSNYSKSRQLAQIRSAGFDIPATIVTNDPQVVEDFRARYGSVIFKSVSSERSIVQLLDDSNMGHLHRIASCPVQFQEFLDGVNIRVHVVGDRVAATEIDSTTIDYRYASRFNGRSELREANLPPEISNRCVELARTFGLEFAGIDLKRTSDGRHCCFEVNTSPAYSFYESHTVFLSTLNGVARTDFDPDD